MSNNERFDAMLGSCQYSWAAYAALQALGSHGIKRTIENAARYSQYRAAKVEQVQRRPFHLR